MKPLILLALALLVAAPSLGCGAENEDSSTRAANPTNPNPAGIGPNNGAAPPPRESIGGRGRGTENIKGK
jgi:hypothetical protein